MAIVNTAIIRQPINWLTVILMILIAGFAVHLVLSHYQDVSQSPAPSSV